MLPRTVCSNASGDSTRRMAGTSRAPSPVRTGWPGVSDSTRLLPGKRCGGPARWVVCQLLTRHSARARLSYAKVRALTRVATRQNEDKLLEMALFATGAQLERLCRAYRSVVAREEAPEPEERSVRRRLLPGGMVRLELVLEPDEADLVVRAIQRAREVHAEQAEPPRESKTESTGKAADVSAEMVSAKMVWPSPADGAVRLAESFLAGNPVSGTGGERFQVVVHLDQEPLSPDGRLGGTLEDGTRVSAETLRRVACDCGLTAAGGSGENLSIGRRTRSIPPAIRRALMLRDRGCAFPGCTHTRFLHGHHVEHWLHGGETRLGNLVMLCTLHHHLVHEGGWTVTAGADGFFLFHPPSGHAMPHRPPTVEVHDILPWLHEWADERALHLGPETNKPLWDGKNPDYALAVEGLLEARVSRRS